MEDTGFARMTTVLVRSAIPDIAALLAGHRFLTTETITPADQDEVEIIVQFGHDPLTDADMAALPRLGLIVVVSAGYDAVDKAAADARGVRFRTGAGAGADDVAEFAVMLALAATRQLLPYDAEARSGAWKARRPVKGFSAHKVGIVGLGHIGRAVAARLAPFGCEIAWTGPRPKPDSALAYVPDLLDLARRSDLLILTAQLDATSRKIVDREVIEALGPEGLLVNVARGGLVDEDALIAALRDGRLGGAALDVFRDEPTPAERWTGVPNLIMTPHTASLTFQAIARVYAQALRHVREYLEEA